MLNWIECWYEQPCGISLVFEYRLKWLHPLGAGNQCQVHNICQTTIYASLILYHRATKVTMIVFQAYRFPGFLAIAVLKSHPSSCKRQSLG